MTFPMTLPACAAALLIAAACGPVAAAGFTGAAAPANFVVTNQGTLDLPASLGSAQFSAVDLLLTGADSAGAGCIGGVQSEIGPCALIVSLNLPGTYRFDYSYVSNDGAGPAYDRFGVIVDGVLTDFTDPGGPVQQGGACLSFTAAQSFSWFVNCTDCTGGSASVQIVNFSTTAVPEPSALGLMVVGLAGVAGVAGAAPQRRRSPA